MKHAILLDGKELTALRRGKYIEVPVGEDSLFIGVRLNLPGIRQARIMRAAKKKTRRGRPPTVKE